MIPEINKILYATDLSENARYAFSYAASLPDRCEQLVDVAGRSRNIRAYDAQCLARQGYREAGSHEPMPPAHRCPNDQQPCDNNRQ